MLEVESDGNSPVEILTFSPGDPVRERWLQRTISNTGERLAAMRDQLLDQAHLPRHGLVLDLKAGSGLLTWEALRRVPEGGVYTLARTPRDAEALRQLAERLPEPERPVVLQGELAELRDLLALQGRLQGDALRFDAIIGYNALLNEPDKAGVIALLAALLTAGGRIVVAERIPRHTQRLYQLVDLSALGQDLVQRVQSAEEAIYTDVNDPMVNWDAPALEALFRAAGYQVTSQIERDDTQLQVSQAVITRWFAPGAGDRLSYGQRLASELDADEVTAVREAFTRQLLQQSVPWTGRLLYLVAEKA
ncbi:MAG: hypothetical protein R2932_32360 [Caldilineaceae bacterium]